MGFLDGLLGNASEVNAEQLQTEFAQILKDAPMELKFTKQLSIYSVQSVLAGYVLR